MDSSPCLREISVCSLFYAIEFYYLLEKCKALQEIYLNQSGYFNYKRCKSDYQGYISSTIWPLPRVFWTDILMPLFW